MEKRRVILYIAMSLDGYIATDEDSLDWLSLVEMPGQDYGYEAFVRQVDTVIMGRKTYEKVLSFGIEFPHKDRLCYVVSGKLTGSDENVTYFGGDLSELIADLKSKPGKNIFIDGGAEVVNNLMRADLIDEYILSVIPIFLGGGKRLFKDGRPEMSLSLVSVTNYESGLVQMSYERTKGGSN